MAGSRAWLEAAVQVAPVEAELSPETEQGIVAIRARHSEVARRYCRAFRGAAAAAGITLTYGTAALVAQLPGPGVAGAVGAGFAVLAAGIGHLGLRMRASLARLRLLEDVPEGMQELTELVARSALARQWVQSAQLRNRSLRAFDLDAARALAAHERRQARAAASAFTERLP